MSNSSDQLYRVRVSTRASSARTISRILQSAGATPVYTEDRTTHRHMFDEYFPRQSEAGSRMDELREQLGPELRQRRCTIECQPLKHEDWSESWKKHFKPRRVSARVVVVPAWKKSRAYPGLIVVKIDPGMSFGTGAHVTSRVCIDLVDRLAKRFPGASLLDVGCGSGVISMAARRLGYHPVAAIDNDPIAVREARANARRNRLAGQIRCVQADVLKFGRHDFDVVVANLLLAEHEKLAKAIVQTMSRRTTTRLVIAGFLKRQYPAAKELYGRLGLQEELRVEQDGWMAGCWQQPVDPV